jgi:GAF domain-containing protein
MSELQEPSTWQEFLGQMIEKPQEKQRMAAAVRVRPITLQRWAEGESRPRDENISLLIKALPAGSYLLFMRLLIRDFPYLMQEELPVERFLAHVPSDFYARSLNVQTFTPYPLCRQAAQDLILQQALAHLDPERHGLFISIVTCVPPRQGRIVRSLREIDGLGTPPWSRTPAEKTIFLGAESLVGYAVSEIAQCVVNTRDEETVFPVRWTENERSAAAFPIMRYGLVAGALVVASAREYFFTKAHLAVLEEYSYMASLMFDLEEFFHAHEISLETMPAYELQAPYFVGYNRRISQKFTEAHSQGAPITLREARQFVWQDLEEELLQTLLELEKLRAPEHGESENISSI